VVRLPRPADAVGADRIVLRGDDHDFDNVHYVVPLKRQEVKLVYVGSDAADDPQGMQYYLRLAVAGDVLRQVEVQRLEGDDSKLLAGPIPPSLVVVTRPLSATLTAELKQYVERGGTLFLAPGNAEATKALPAFIEALELGEEKPSTEDDFVLFGEIDFTHPLFTPLASPRYSDFTKIHFWRHRPIKVVKDQGPSVVARFDNGDLALVDQPLGKGRVLALASGWNPDDSQLALSTKFVPMIGGLLDLACGSQKIGAGLIVNDPAPLALPQPRSAVVIQSPDGSNAKLAADADRFTDTKEPGVYRATSAAEELRFAVNLAAAESNTAPLELEQLEQLGVRVGTDLTRAERLQRERQKRDTELESSQKVWRWMLVAMLGLLVVETWWAGRAARQLDAPKPETVETAV
jgi:hypothetical protein